MPTVTTVKWKLFTKIGVESSCSSCHKTVTFASGRGLRGDDFNNAFHEKCIPKYHKEHIHISEDGNYFLCHMFYKVKPSGSSRPSNEIWQEKESDYNDYDDDDIDELFCLANIPKFLNITALWMVKDTYSIYISQYCWKYVSGQLL